MTILFIAKWALTREPISPLSLLHQKKTHTASFLLWIDKMLLNFINGFVD